MIALFLQCRNVPLAIVVIPLRERSLRMWKKNINTHWLLYNIEHVLYSSEVLYTILLWRVTFKAAMIQIPTHPSNSMPQVINPMVTNWPQHFATIVLVYWSLFNSNQRLFLTIFNSLTKAGYQKGQYCTWVVVSCLWSACAAVSKWVSLFAGKCQHVCIVR